MRTGDELIALKKKIDRDFWIWQHDGNDKYSDLETTVKLFELVLSEFYEDLSLYLIERYESEMGKNIAYKDRVDRFYHIVQPHRHRQHIINNYIQEFHGENSVLDKLVYKTRKNLHYGQRLGGNGLMYLTESRCHDTSINFQKALEEETGMRGVLLATSRSFGIPNNPHVFNYVITKDKDYIVDCTFSQFTKLYRMNLGIIKIPKEVTNAEPVYFLMQTAEGMNILNKLLTYGYFEATKENIKLYLDSFVLSNRNAKYYLNHDDSIFESGTNGDFYITELDKLIKLGNPKDYENFHFFHNYNLIPSIYGLDNITFTEPFLSKEEISKINQKIFIK